MEDTESLQRISIAGAYHRVEPLFINNSAVLCALGTSIQKLSSKTGELIATQHAHESRITRICLVSSHENLVLSSSIDGCLILWCHETMDVIRRWKLNSPILDIIIPQRSLNCPNLMRSINKESNESIDELYLVVSSRLDGTFSQKLIIFDLEKQKVRRFVTMLYPFDGNSNSSEILNKRLIASTIPEDSNEEYFIIAKNCHKSSNKVMKEQAELLIWCVSSRSAITVPISYGYITCLQVCDGLFVTGHATGDVIIWNNFPKAITSKSSHFKVSVDDLKGKKNITFPSVILNAVSTKLSWHAHPVSALCISNKLIISGGEEGVIVIWQTLSGKLGKKTFIPRFGAAITNLYSFPETSLVCITTDDSSIRLLNIASRKEEWLVSSLVFPNRTTGKRSNSNYIPSSKSFAGKLTVESRSGNIVSNSSNGRAGCLQVLSVNAVSQHSVYRGTYQITEYARVSVQESNSSFTIFEPSITNFQFHTFNLQDKTEFYLATVDIRRGEYLDEVCSLKIFRFDSSKSSYVLISQLENPHGKHHVSSIIFSSNINNLFIFSGAEDGSLKQWCLVPEKDSWICLCSFHYREASVTAIAASNDGSLIAVLHGTVLDLWDPLSVSLKSSLSIASSKFYSNKCKRGFVKFIEPKQHGGGCGKVSLLVANDVSVAVFDLLTLECNWIVESNNDSIFTCFSSVQDNIDSKLDVQFSCASVSGSSSQVLFFNLDSDVPLKNLKVDSPVCSLAFTEFGIVFGTDHGDVSFVKLSNPSADSSIENIMVNSNARVAPQWNRELEQSDNVMFKNTVETVSSTFMQDILDANNRRILDVSSLFGSFMSLLALPSSEANLTEAAKLPPSSKIEISSDTKSNPETNAKNDSITSLFSQTSFDNALAKYFEISHLTSTSNESINSRKSTRKRANSQMSEQSIPNSLISSKQEIRSSTRRKNQK